MPSSPPASPPQRMASLRWIQTHGASPHRVPASCLSLGRGGGGQGQSTSDRSSIGRSGGLGGLRLSLCIRVGCGKHIGSVGSGPGISVLGACNEKSQVSGAYWPPQPPPRPVTGPSNTETAAGPNRRQTQPATSKKGDTCPLPTIPWVQSTRDDRGLAHRLVDGTADQWGIPQSTPTQFVPRHRNLHVNDAGGAPQAHWQAPKLLTPRPPRPTSS